MRRVRQSRSLIAASTHVEVPLTGLSFVSIRVRSCCCEWSPVEGGKSVTETFRMLTVKSGMGNQRLETGLHARISSMA